MSRSYKKEPIIKDPSNSKGKRFANRKLRRAVKQAIHNEEETLPVLKEAMNTYDIVDFKIYGHGSEDKIFVEKLKRK